MSRSRPSRSVEAVVEHQRPGAQPRDGELREARAIGPNEHQRARAGAGDEDRLVPGRPRIEEDALAVADHDGLALAFSAVAPRENGDPLAAGGKPAHHLMVTGVLPAPPT